MRSLFLALVVFIGCAENMSAPDDAGTTIFPDAMIVEPPGSCACEDSEDCMGCMQHIGTCCYDDPTIGGQAESIADTCAKNAACKACCNECKAKSCDALKANNECPNLSQQ